jgi:D-aminoacyl-tRNA deacylase
MSIPTLFIEVGSNNEEWIKKEPSKIVAKSVLDLLSRYRYEEDIIEKMPVLLGIGGGHYAPRFTDVGLEKNVAFGHMIPSYHIDSGNINYEMLEKAIQKTPNVEGVYFHRKALKKSQITKYKEWFENRGIPSVSSNDFPNLD